VNLVRIATWSEVPDGVPSAASAEGVDLVIVRRGDEHSVLYGRCLHRGALLADGHIQGNDLICGLHGWDYRIASGVSAYNNAEALERFTSVVEGDELLVDLDATVHLMQVLARACGHHALSQFCVDDITTFDRDMAALAGIPYSGVER